jgi:Ca-activated chloride channel family protein
MLPPLFILFGLLLTQKEAQETFFSPEVMERLRVSANTLTMKARNALFMLIGFLVIIALADPVIKEGKVDIKAKSADIMIALDISDSMLATDVYPNRLALAKQKALEFLKLSPNERIGVIAFAKNSYLVSPLSFDHEAVAFLLSKLDTTSITEQGTDFLSMLEVAARSIKNEKKYLLLLSDGGDKEDFSAEIAYAKAHNIVVFVIGIGTKKGAPIKAKNGEFIKQNGKIILTKLNEKMADLAIKTGGIYIQGVNSNADVKAMLREIENGVVKKELKSQEIEKYIPLFYYPVGLALILLLIATSSMSKREEVQVPSLFLLGFLLLTTPEAKAGLFDFVELKNAKEAYSMDDFKAAAREYEKYAKQKESSEAYYDAGNAYYKAKEYKKALKSYEKAIFADPKKRAQKFANEGNAYARLGSDEDLKKAIEAYEESLKLQNDAAVRENLERVKEELKKRKKQKNKEQKKEKNKQNQQNKDQQNKNKQNQDQQNKQDQQKQQNKQENNQKSSKQDQKEQDQQNKQKSQQEQQKEKRKSDKQSQEEKQNQEKKDAKEQKSQDSKASKEKKKEQKKQLKELSKDKENKDKNERDKKSAQAMQQQQQSANKMSDAEEKKWLKALSEDQSTFLYMLNDPNKKKEDTNEKPW